jgi:hypothetical protein
MVRSQILLDKGLYIQERCDLSLASMMYAVRFSGPVCMHRATFGSAHHAADPRTPKAQPYTYQMRYTLAESKLHLADLQASAIGRSDAAAGLLDP